MPIFQFPPFYSTSINTHTKCMVPLLMGSRGLTFDGLDQSTIITNVIIETTDKNQAAYFQATNTTNQFTTTQANLELAANSANPNFNFENYAGVTTSSNLNAGKVTLASTDTSPVTILSTLAPNLSSTGTVQYLLGKNQSSNATSFYLKYVHDLIYETNRRFSIQAFGKGDSMSVYIPEISATSTEGTLVVNGGVSAKSLYTIGNITTGNTLVGTALNVSGGSVTCSTVNASGSITGTIITGSSLNLSSGAIIAGAITGTSLNVSGTVTCGQVSSSGSITGTSLIGTSLNVSTGSITGGTITGTTQTLTKSTPGQILYLLSSESGATTTTTGLFLVRHNSSSITDDLYTLGEFFAPNMPSATSAEIRVGKNAASSLDSTYNAFSAMFGHYYSTTASLRKGYIRLNNLGNTIEFFQPSVVGTTASTGSVVVTGDLATSGVRATSLNLYESTTNANAVRLQAATSTAAYTLKFPTTLGTTNDYLQLGASGQLQWSAGTGGGSGGSAAYVSAASYTSASTSYASGSTFLVVAFGTNNYDVNTSIGYNPSPGTYPYFRNNSGGTIYVQVNAIVEYSSTTLTTYRHAQIRTTTSSSVDPIGGTFTTVMQSWNAPSTNSPGAGQTCTLAGIVKLLSNECFIIVTRQNTGSALSATAQIQFSVLGGSGLQSITLNSTSGFLTGTAQTTGLNPTINVGLANAPTGSGTTLVASTSPTITTPTITSPTITGTIYYSGSLTPYDLSTYALYLRNGALNQVTITASSPSDTYSLTLPPNIGSAGQILSSTGTGWDWATIGTYIGTSGTSITSPLLTLDGTSTSSTVPNLLIRDYRSGSQQAPLSIQAPNLTSGQEVCIRLGKANSTNNSAKLSYNFSSSGSSTNNFGVGHYGQSDSITVYPPNLASTLTVIGGAQATDLIITGKSDFGTSTRSVSISPTCTTSGKSSGNTSPVLQVNNYSDSMTTATTISAYTPSLPLTKEAAIRFGKSDNSLNSGVLGFTYDADGTSANYINLRLHSQVDSVKIYKDSISASSTTTATLVSKGGIGCTSLNTDSAIINSIDITPTGGTQTDLTLWWAYRFTDPSTNNTLAYPSIPGTPSSGIIPNQYYYWQRIGKSYSFSLNFYCTIGYTSAQLHLLFLRMDSHTPPTPASGEYTMRLNTDGGSTESYSDDVQFGLGTYIPAMYF